MTDDVVGTPITLGGFDVLHYTRGTRVEFRPPARWYVRVWRWLAKQNLRVAAVDYRARTITLEWCR